METDTKKIYFLNEDYYDFLTKTKKLKKFWGKPKRPYVGFIKTFIKGNNYLVPLWTNKTQIPSEELTLFCVPIKNKSNELLGYLRIDKMIPVGLNDDFCKPVDFKKSSPDWTNQVKEQLKFINKARVENLANFILYQTSTDTNNLLHSEKKDLKYAIDFKKAEQYCKEYSLLTTNKKDLFDSKTVINEPIDKKYLDRAIYLLSEENQNTIVIPFNRDKLLEDYENNQLDTELYLSYIKYSLYLARKNNAKEIWLENKFSDFSDCLLTNKQIAFETFISIVDDKITITDDGGNSKNWEVYGVCNYLLNNDEIKNIEQIKNTKLDLIPTWSTVATTIYDEVKLTLQSLKTLNTTPATERETMINLDQRIINILFDGKYTKINKLKNQGEIMSNTQELENKKEEVVETTTQKDKKTMDTKYFSYVFNKCFVGSKKDNPNLKYIKIKLNEAQEVVVQLKEKSFVKNLGAGQFAVKIDDVETIKGKTNSLKNPGKVEVVEMNSFALQALDNFVKVKHTKSLEKSADTQQVQIEEKELEKVNVVENKKVKADLDLIEDLDKQENNEEQEQEM